MEGDSTVERMSLNVEYLRRLDVLKDIKEKCLWQRKEDQIIGIRPRQVLWLLRRLATGGPIPNMLQKSVLDASACRNLRANQHHPTYSSWVPSVPASPGLNLGRPSGRFALLTCSPLRRSAALSNSRFWIMFGIKALYLKELWCQTTTGFPKS